ncbi:S2-RNase [Pyrus ussuriensis x Pyrus communis]|uniref:S2-RNase n=1 Tax=Pyrus ussuriensis x Pyrus communis TaxID=2448454 RepID=A0A5N5HUR5_9ROSA|nr:S2-RNase [Pyrus ussuriensis x Pyrus communis]
MDNGIYELIMLSKVAVIAKPELLTITLIFWNNGTNTFDFRMGPMFPTVLDMALFFGLRSSGRYVDITYDWSLSFCSTTKALGTSESITHLEYTHSTFKSYGMRYLWFSDQIFQDVFEEDTSSLRKEKFLFGDLEAEVRPKVETRAVRRARAIMPQLRLALLGLRATSTKKRTRPPPTKKPIPTSNEGQSGAKVQKEDKEIIDTILDELKSSSMHEATKQPPTTFEEPIVLEILVVSEVTSPMASQAASPTVDAPTEAFGEDSGKVTGIPILRPKKTITAATSASGSFPSISTEAASKGANVMLHPLASILATTSLPELVKEFGQIKTKLRSPMRHSKPQLLQDSHRVFKEWM